MIENYFNIPTIVLRGMVVFPEMIIHFDVGREKSIKALNKAMEGDRRVFLALQKDITDDDPDSKSLLNYGCLAVIKQVLKVPGENTIKALVEGISRAKLTVLFLMNLILALISILVTMLFRKYLH